MNEIKPISMPGIHTRFLPFFFSHFPDKSKSILDVGAGHGAFCKEMHELGYQIHACDLFPEYFYYKEMECKKADITKSIPFGDAQFDGVVAMEVMEHILDHEQFLREAYRVLKPGGKLFVSTPNVVSLKSRLRFFMTGFFYSFQPLELRNYDGLQHISSLTPDQYNYAGIKNGFKPVQIKIDRRQGTSSALLIFYPIMWIFSKIKKVEPIHNTIDLLLGRVIFLIFEKDK